MFPLILHFELDSHRSIFTRMSDKPKVLIVCLGNICRSPMGEAVLAHVAKERGIALHVESAGTAGYHVGQEPDERSVQIVRSQVAAMANRYPTERLLSARRYDRRHRPIKLLVIDTRNMTSSTKSLLNMPLNKCGHSTSENSTTSSDQIQPI